MDDMQNLLSDRELEILSLVATGVTNAQVAQELDISPNTVKVHLRNIYAKLGVESRTEATTLAIRMGWIALDSLAEDDGREAIPSSQEPPQQRETLALWKRLYLVAVISLVALALFLRPASRREARADPFIDHGITEAVGLGRTAANRWSEVAALPAPKARLALVGRGSEMWAIGGDAEGGIVGEVWSYDVARNRWEERSGKPVPAANIGATLVGNRAYVPGGYGPGGQALDVLEVYDLDADAWEVGTALPEPRFAYAIASFGDRVYLLGGSDGQGYVDTTYIYDTERDEWARGPRVPGPARGFAAAGAVDGRIYLVGGYDGAREYDLCYRLDAQALPEPSAWQPCTPMLAPRGGHAVAVAEGYLFVIGGGWDSYLYFNERYNVQDDSWSSVETPILGQWRTLGAAALAHGGEKAVHAVGGWNSGYLDVNERYRPFFYVNLPIIP